MRHRLHALAAALLGGTRPARSEHKVCRRGPQPASEIPCRPQSTGPQPPAQGDKMIQKRFITAAAMALATMALATIAVGLGQANADTMEDVASACDSTYRITYTESTCTNGNILNYQNRKKYTLSNSCARYGTLVASVELRDNDDRKHTMDQGSWAVHALWTPNKSYIEGISCCLDQSDLCYLNQVEQNASGTIKVLDTSTYVFADVDVNTHAKRYQFCPGEPERHLLHEQPLGRCLYGDAGGERRVRRRALPGAGLLRQFRRQPGRGIAEQLHRVDDLAPVVGRRSRPGAGLRKTIGRSLVTPASYATPTARAAMASHGTARYLRGKPKTAGSTIST